MIGAGIVLVDRPLDEAEAERFDPEIHVLLGIARDAGHVVNPRCWWCVCHCILYVLEVLDFALTRGLPLSDSMVIAEEEYTGRSTYYWL